MKYFADRNSKQVFKKDPRKLRAMGLVNTNIFLSLRPSSVAYDWSCYDTICSSPICQLAEKFSQSWIIDLEYNWLQWISGFIFSTCIAIYWAKKLL